MIEGRDCIGVCIMDNNSALLIGATGLVGSELLKLLLDSPEYGKIKIFIRNELAFEHPKLEKIIIEFDHLDKYKDHFHVKDVYCCLGTTIKRAGTQAAFRKVDYDFPLQLAQLAKSGGVENYMVITAMGADQNSKVFYNRVKGELEGKLKKLGLQGLHIFQPSLLLGERSEFRLGEKIAILLSPVFSFLFVGAMRKYKPIHAKNVAKSMYKIAIKSETGTFTYQSDVIDKISKE
jgi:uncharacterized protein YbjT (DUF2867 family)